MFRTPENCILTRQSSLGLGFGLVFTKHTIQKIYTKHIIHRIYTLYNIYFVNLPTELPMQLGQPGYLRNFIKRQKVRPECKSTFFPLMTKWHKDRSPPSLLPDPSNKIILHWGLMSSIWSFAFEPSCNKTGKYGVTTAGSRPGAKKTRRKRRGRRWILIPIQGQRGQHKYNTDTLGNTKE